MKVFISGATGVLGSRVVQSLVASGHRVVGLARSQANVDWLDRQGAEAQMGDLFDGEQMRELSTGCDAILHLATAIPTKAKPSPADWAMNDRIRREGTQNLVGAAIRNRCRLFVQQSVTFLYGDRGGAWVDEKDEVALEQGIVLQSALDMERVVQTAVLEERLPAKILRFGTFYSHDSAQTRTLLALAQKRKFPVIGDGGAYWNMIHVDDAALAVVKAVENHESATSNIYNVCDDEPVTYRDLLDYIALKLGVGRPMSLPVWLARLLMGAGAVDFLCASVRCRNRRVKEELGWQPNFPTYRAGFQSEIEKWLSSN